MSYTGRFAPSPTGLLHFGSLLAATASYLDARSQQGRWLVRIEDLDKPREQAGATASILQTLSSYGFEQDGEIILQSQRLDAYHEALRLLSGHIYACTCTRKQLIKTARNGTYGIIYPGTCRHRAPPSPKQPRSIRLRTNGQPICFQDQIQGLFCQNLQQEIGDFIVRRSDGLFAYQLAVVVDDAWQGITHIVRGADLLDNTPRQLYLQQLLGYPTPAYAHIPLAMNAHGQKLSKQSHAPAITAAHKLENLCAALNCLGQTPPAAKEFGSLRECWDWAIRHWVISKAPRSIQNMLPDHDTSDAVQ